MLIALGTTGMTAAGLTMQKLVHKRLEGAREAALRKHQVNPKHLRSYRQKLWIIGLILMALGAVVSLAVFALLGQAVASAMASVTLLWNAGLASRILKERFTVVDAVSTTLLIAGAVIVVYFGQFGSSSTFLNIDDVLATINRPGATVPVFSAMIAVVMAVVMLIIYAIVYRYNRLRPLPPILWSSLAFFPPFMAGIFSGWTGFLSKGFVTSLSAAFKYGAYESTFTSVEVRTSYR